MKSRYFLIFYWYFINHSVWLIFSFLFSDFTFTLTSPLYTTHACTHTHTRWYCKFPILHLKKRKQKKCHYLSKYGLFSKSPYRWIQIFPNFLVLPLIDYLVGLPMAVRIQGRDQTKYDQIASKGNILCMRTSRQPNVSCHHESACQWMVWAEVCAMEWWPIN